jgi:hypothetical protein
MPLFGKCSADIFKACEDSAPTGRKSCCRLLDTSVNEGENTNSEIGTTIQVIRHIALPCLDVTKLDIIFHMNASTLVEKLTIQYIWQI